MQPRTHLALHRVPAVTARHGRRVARIAFDDSGLFVSVDGDEESHLRVVQAALDAALFYAISVTRIVEPLAIRQVSVPVCHGAIYGHMHPRATGAVLDSLRRAGYEPG